MVALIMIAYFVGAILAYFWWVKECKKFNKGEKDAKALAEEASESGFFFAMFWFVFVPIYCVGVLIEWIKKK